VEGEVGKVYEGALAFDREEIDPATLPEPPVPLMLNVASPEMAFHHAQLPSAGVGLMRIEFLITDWIGIHPMALVRPDRVADRSDRQEIRRRTAAFASPTEFFVDRLASGVAQIAAAFYPRPVIVRFSDFKTNEYAGLIGGAAFEPMEANPMIGFRGASRYYDARYREGFALECAAIRRVRERMGLTNVKVMIPFCRTVQEGRDVLSEMKQNGLERGDDGLEVYVMCEIPNNVILAEQFSELFDGFSIGSNDLTQLTLGIDRDSELLSHLFEERDPGVKQMITMVVEAAHRCGRPVGICGWPRLRHEGAGPEARAPGFRAGRRLVSSGRGRRVRPGDARACGPRPWVVCPAHDDERRRVMIAAPRSARKPPCEVHEPSPSSRSSSRCRSSPC
jgi:pyruvate,water dikinase